MEKKAQAALEFLMTYGWAILVVLVVISALAYFGVLNPTILLPERCTLQLGLGCKNYLVLDNNTMYFELENRMGKGIIIEKVNVSGQVMNCAVNLADPASPWNDGFGGKNGLHIENGQSRIFAISNSTTATWESCTTLPKIGKTRADIKVNWFFDDANVLFTHTMTGELLVEIGEGGTR